MKKRISIISIFVVFLFVAFALTACVNEADALREQVSTLENENTELQSTISSLRTELERTQASLFSTQNELQTLIDEQEAMANDEQGDQGGPLAITYGGEPNEDMSWPFRYGELALGLRVNLNNLNEDDEIIWRSADESIFTVTPGEDGMTAIVTPETIGDALLIVTVGDQETRSWVRIT